MSLYLSCLIALSFVQPIPAQKAEAQYPYYLHIKSVDQAFNDETLMKTDVYRIYSNRLGQYLLATCYHGGSGIETDYWTLFWGDDRNGYDEFLHFSHRDGGTHLVFRPDKGLFVIRAGDSNNDLDWEKIDSSIILNILSLKKADARSEYYAKPSHSLRQSNSANKEWFSGTEASIIKAFASPNSKIIKIEFAECYNLLVIGRMGANNRIESWHIFQKPKVDFYVAVFDYRVPENVETNLKVNEKTKKIEIWSLRKSKDKGTLYDRQLVYLNLWGLSGTSRISIG